MNKIIIPLLLAALLQAGLVSYPLRITVQRGDTVEFTPMIKGWNRNLTGVSVSHSSPSHGSIIVLSGFFTTQKYVINHKYFSYDTARYCPRNFPGFRYVASPGFTGIDTFSFKIRTATDSTMLTKCEIRVYPPDPGHNTVLIVVNSALLSSISSEVTRLKIDLESEGFTGKIVSFPDHADYNDTAAARELWDTLSTEYSKADKFMAGAILIGNIPFAKDLRGVYKDVYFWSMSAWLNPLEKDTANPVIGSRVMQDNKGKGLYLRSVPNVWVSRISGKSQLVNFGAESDIVKSILQNNHDYRTGTSRLPSTALYYNLRSLAEKNMDNKRLLNIWPSLYVRPRTDSSVSPLYRELRVGGDVWDLSCHAGNGTEYRSYESNANGYAWFFRVNVNDLARSHVQVRAIIAQNCHSAVPEKLAASTMMSRNNHCVLIASSGDYAQESGELSPTDTSRWPGTVEFNEYLKQGDRWGRAWQRSNMSLWGTIFYGDLSLRPNMTPHNSIPIISGFTAEKKGIRNWQFSSNAIDSDGTIQLYEWFPNGYDFGKAVPVASSVSASSINYTFNSSALCTLRVEVEDNYKARDFLEVIFSPDTGIVKILSPFLSTGTLSYEKENNKTAQSTFHINPNPFTSNTKVIWLGESGIDGLSIFNLYGQSIRKLTVYNKSPNNSFEFAWDGRDNLGRRVSEGVYFCRIDSKGKNIYGKIILSR
ncbi:MAG: T9SS type A sorting domain-containing protein [Fibrobacteres bacterium]|nr:T9SS type A sorting domain-containing protein [Fibrobacterota bacterium]